MPELQLVERYEMWFEIIYWQPCNFCFAYMPGRPKGSSAAGLLPCMGVATQMSRPCPMCPTPSGQEEYHTKNTQNTSKSILESNRMKNQMSVTDLPAASRPLVGPTGPDVPVTTVISQTIGPYILIL